MQLAERNKSTKQLMTYLAKKDEVGLAELESSLTIQDGMQAIQLRVIERTQGKKPIIKAITYLLLRLSENFNVGKKFTTSQAVTAASDLLEVFGYESMEDVMLMLKYARQGKIGDGKEFKLDSQTIFHKWVPSYLELKAQERERAHQQQKSSQNNIYDFKWDKEAVKKLKVSRKKYGWRESLEEMDRRMKKKKNQQAIEEARQRIEKLNQEE